MMKTKIGALLLVIIGLLQIAGDLLHLPAIKILGLALQASPAPKVFTAQNGFETYSSNFYIDWTDKENHLHSLHLTPDIYHQIQGPYNRRNAYGAALSYAPVFNSNPKTVPMLDSVMQYAFCNKKPILKELGINPDLVNATRVRIVPRQKLETNHTWKLIYEINCNS